MNDSDSESAVIAAARAWKRAYAIPLAGLTISARHEADGARRRAQRALLDAAGNITSVPRTPEAVARSVAVVARDLAKRLDDEDVVLAGDEWRVDPATAEGDRITLVMTGDRHHSARVILRVESVVMPDSTVGGDVDHADTPVETRSDTYTEHGHRYPDGHVEVPFDQQYARWQSHPDVAVVERTVTTWMTRTAWRDAR